MWYGVGNAVSNRPTFWTNRNSESSTRDSARVTFTLQRCYRISRRRCNRRCNLCLVLRASAYGLRYNSVMYAYIYAFYINNALDNGFFFQLHWILLLSRKNCWICLMCVFCLLFDRFNNIVRNRAETSWDENLEKLNNFDSIRETRQNK